MNDRVSNKIVFFVYLLLTIGTAVCYLQVRNFDFINYDDNLYVYKNPHVLNGLTFEGVGWAFRTGHAANWHPLTWLSLMFDNQLFGPDPGWIHLENVLWHIFNVLLLFAILKKLTHSLWPSAFVAALFAIHPMHVQSVAWIAERKDVLSTTFFMLTLLAYTSYVKCPSIFRYSLSLIFFATGLMAKPMLVTLPFILVLLDYWPLNRFAPESVNSRHSAKTTSAYKIILEKIPFFILAAASSAITFLVQRTGGAMADFNHHSFTDRLVNAFVSYATYIGKLFWPYNLSVFYPFNAASFKSWQIILCILLLFMISVFVICFARKYKYLPVGWFWFIGTLVPVIGLVQVGDQAFADRYTYISYIGLFIIVAWSIPNLFLKWQYSKPALALSAIIVISVLGWRTYLETKYWYDSLTLFTHALEIDKANYLAHGCLASKFREEGKISLAVEHITKTLEIKPDYPNAVLDLGCTFADAGNLDKAMECFQKTLQLKINAETAAIANNNLGLIFQQKDRFSDSLDHFRKAVQLKPDYAEARYNLAYEFLRQGSVREAVEQLNWAVRLKPDWPDPMNNLAWILATSAEPDIRNPTQAVEFAQRACIATNYKRASFLDTLGIAYASAGRFSEAIEIFQKALSLLEKDDMDIRRAIQAHLDLYKTSRPYIEPQPGNKNVK